MTSFFTESLRLSIFTYIFYSGLLEGRMIQGGPSGFSEKSDFDILYMISSLPVFIDRKHSVPVNFPSDDVFTRGI